MYLSGVLNCTNPIFWAYDMIRRNCILQMNQSYAYFHIVSSHCCISIYVPPFHVLNSLVLHDILKRVLPMKDDYGDAWLASRHKLLSVFREALSSCCARLVRMIQVLIMLNVYSCKSSW